MYRPSIPEGYWRGPAPGGADPGEEGYMDRPVQQRPSASLGHRTGFPPGTCDRGDQLTSSPPAKQALRQHVYIELGVMFI